MKQFVLWGWNERKAVAQDLKAIWSIENKMSAAAKARIAAAARARWAKAKAAGKKSL